MSREVELLKNDGVKNLEGTGNAQKIGGRNWKGYWDKYSSEEWPKMCRVKFCGNEAYCGAHVELDDQEGVFILPTCLPCNQSRDDWMPVKSKTFVVEVVYNHDEENNNGLTWQQHQGYHIPNSKQHQSNNIPNSKQHQSNNGSNWQQQQNNNAGKKNNAILPIISSHIPPKQQFTAVNILERENNTVYSRKKSRGCPPCTIL